MKKILLSIFSIMILVGACSKDEILTDPDNLLIGVWNYTDFQDDKFIFSRSNEFIDNHCYRFNCDGTLTERKNAGFCGTPPITYADYSGKWTLINDTLIQISVGFWGGTTKYKLNIEALDQNSFKTSYVQEDN